MGTIFPKQRYLWRCPTNCGFVAPMREDWDETPGLEYCPHCGVPLERVSCPHCDAPIFWSQVMGSRGDVIIRKARHCGYCGESTEVVERKMREKPAPPPPPPTTDLYGDNLIMGKQKFNPFRKGKGEK